MLTVEYTSQFKRDLKLSKKRNNNLEKLYRIMQTIESEGSLNPIFKDHRLSNNWHGHRELHIEPDWLLIYKILPKKKIVIFVRLGTHADLFT